MWESTHKTATDAADLAQDEQPWWLIVLFIAFMAAFIYVKYDTDGNEKRQKSTDVTLTFSGNLFRECSPFEMLWISVIIVLLFATGLVFTMIFIFPFLTRLPSAE